VVPVPQVVSAGATATARLAKAVVGAAGVDGYWLHLDVDILDPEFMPAVDSPDPGGLDPVQLRAVLRELAPGAIGADVTVFDPDLDPDGRYADLLTEVIVDGLERLGDRAGR
jgi:arginase